MWVQSLSQTIYMGGLNRPRQTCKTIQANQQNYGKDDIHLVSKNNKHEYSISYRIEQGDIVLHTSACKVESSAITYDISIFQYKLHATQPYHSKFNLQTTQPFHFK